LTRQLILTPAAIADLDAIYRDSSDRWGNNQARSYLQSLDRILRLLADHPEIARLRPEFKTPINLHPFRSHLVVFRNDEMTLDVIRIVHARSNWQGLLND
jgi:toxin ParE1/3/4